MTKNEDDGRPPDFGRWPAERQLLYLNLRERFATEAGNVLDDNAKQRLADLSVDAAMQTIEDCGGMQVEPGEEPNSLRLFLPRFDFGQDEVL